MLLFRAFGMPEVQLIFYQNITKNKTQCYIQLLYKIFIQIDLFLMCNCRLSVCRLNGIFYICTDSILDFTYLKIICLCIYKENDIYLNYGSVVAFMKTEIIYLKNVTLYLTKLFIC